MKRRILDKMIESETLQSLISQSGGGFDQLLLQKLTVERVCKDTKTVDFQLPVEDMHLNVYGTAHGGFIATLVDICGTFSLTKRRFGYFCCA